LEKLIFSGLSKISIYFSTIILHIFLILFFLTSHLFTFHNPTRNLFLVILSIPFLMVHQNHFLIHLYHSWSIHCIPIPDPSIPIHDPSIPYLFIPIPDPSIPIPDPSIPIPDPSLPILDPSLPIPDPSIPIPDSSLPIPDPSMPFLIHLCHS